MSTLMSNDREHHSLLEPPSMEYSASTVQRACLVWMRLGQRNRFTDVCGYYHRLEALEETLPAEQRASSRNLEYSLPPASSYLQDNHPSLYPDLTSLVQQHDVMRRLNELKVTLAAVARKENTTGYQAAGMAKNEITYQQVPVGYAVNHNMNIVQNRGTFEQGLRQNGQTYQEFTGPVNGQALINKVASQKVDYIQGKTDQEHGLVIQNGTTKEDIVATSNIIRSYCTTHQVTLNQFLAEFRVYATKHGVNPTVSNVAFYIKHRTVLEERAMEAYMNNGGWRKLFTSSPVVGIEGKATDEFNFQCQRTKKAEVNNSDILKSIFTDGNVSDRFSKGRKSQLEPENGIDEILDLISQLRSMFNDEVKEKKPDSEGRLNVTENRDVLRHFADVTEKLPIGIQPSNLLLNAISMSEDPKDNEIAMSARTQNGPVETAAIPTAEKVEIIKNGKQSAMTIDEMCIV